MVSQRQLANELSSVVKIAVQEQKNGTDTISNDVTNSVSNILEAIFIHGLRESYFMKNREKYPQPNFWPFIQKFTHRNIRAQIGNLNQIKNDVGRSRVWLRIALNDGLLENYVTSIVREPQIVVHYYHRHAFLRDAEEIEVMSNYVRALSKLTFKAPINSNMLNSWTPTPLKLAGLMENQKQLSATVETDQTDIVEAMSALEFEGLEDNGFGFDASSDAVSVAFSGASPESIPAFNRTGDQSIFSDGDSVLSSLPESFKQNESDSLLPLILNEFTKGNFVASDVNATDLVSPDILTAQPDTIRYSPETLTRESTVEEEIVQEDFKESTSYDKPDDETEENRSSPLASNKIYVPGMDNELGFSFSPSNGSLGRNHNGGWSSSHLTLEDCERYSSSDRVDSPLLAENNFSQAINNIMETTNALKLDSNDDDAHPSTLSFSNSNATLNESLTVEEISQIESNVCEAESSSNYVIVENPIPQIEPAEKAFRISLLTKFGNEVGLNHQDYKCNSCKRSIGLMFGVYRLCAFDGHYYCTECHLDEESVIPARVLFNWDLKPRKVCRASKAFLDHIADQPSIRLSQANPTLFDVIEKMKEVQALRLQLSYVAMYLLACREIVAEDLRKRIWPKEYLYQDVDMFSITDLTNAVSGQLQKHLKSVIQFATKHVLDSCLLCANKGFVCEICNDSKIIYPFQMDVTQRCIKCYSVYHKSCTDGRPCPKCVRRELYSKNTLDSGIEMPPFGDA